MERCGGLQARKTHRKFIIINIRYWTHSATKNIVFKQKLFWMEVPTPANFQADSEIISNDLGSRFG